MTTPEFREFLDFHMAEWRGLVVNGYYELAAKEVSKILVEFARYCAKYPGFEREISHFAREILGFLGEEGDIKGKA